MESRRDHALLYDDDCGFCKLCVRGMLRLDRDERLLPISIQSEEGQRLLTEVPESERLASMHLVTPGGVVLSGGQALPLISKLVPGGAVPARAMRRFQSQTDSAYRFIAGNRSFFGRIGLRSRKPIPTSRD